MMQLNRLPFFPTTDSGDVSSIKDVDLLVLLRVPSSCQSEHIDYYVMSHFTKWFVFFERFCDTALYKNSQNYFTVVCKEKQTMG